MKYLLDSFLISIFTASILISRMSSNNVSPLVLKMEANLRIKQEKGLEKKREKAEKLAAKERDKAEKLAAKERIQAEKLASKERIQAEKLASKERDKANKEHKRAENRKMNLIKKQAYLNGIKEGKKQSKINQEKKKQKQNAKFEIKKESITKLVQVSRALSTEYPNQGFRISQITEKYIEMHGKINPYSTEEAEAGYDVHAAIRGIVYESSPSSAQHWFRFGQKKDSTQICPWIFANKELALVNNEYEWRKTTDEMVSARRNSEGLWFGIVESNAQYCWNEDKYGPLPTKAQLDTAEELGERAIGIRNH